jgi:hypothetical protein
MSIWILHHLSHPTLVHLNLVSPPPPFLPRIEQGVSCHFNDDGIRDLGVWTIGVVGIHVVIKKSM